MIENGIIKDGFIDGVEVVIDLIPVSNVLARPQLELKPTSITVHNTGDKHATAQQETEYVDNTQQYVSWHFTVDDKQIIQELPINEIAWHAGDGYNGKGNRTSVAIEVCEYLDINWKVARENAIKLINYLQYYYPHLEVVPHKHWLSEKYPYGKHCPHKILDEGWGNFIFDVKTYELRKENKQLKDKIKAIKDIL